jgi:hypothetical protein
MQNTVWNVSFILKATVLMEQNGITDEVVVQPKQVAAPTNEAAVTQMLMDPDIHDKLMAYNAEKGRLVPVVIAVANP